MKREDLLTDDEALDRALAALEGSPVPAKKASKMARTALAAAGLLSVSNAVHAWAIGTLVVGSLVATSGTAYLVLRSGGQGGVLSGGMESQEIPPKGGAIHNAQQLEELPSTPLTKHKALKIEEIPPTPLEGVAKGSHPPSNLTPHRSTVAPSPKRRGSEVSVSIPYSPFPLGKGARGLGSPEAELHLSTTPSQGAQGGSLPPKERQGGSLPVAMESPAPPPHTRASTARDPCARDCCCGARPYRCRSSNVSLRISPACQRPKI